MILTAGFAATVVGCWLSYDAMIERAEERMVYRSTSITTAITERMHAYELALRSAVGLFAASDRVSRADWTTFANSLELQQLWHGGQALGVSVPVADDQKKQHEESVRAEGLPEYRIWPSGERPFYAATVYVEPFNSRNQRAVGYDMWTSPERKTAMTAARDSGLATISGMVRLVQDVEDKNRQSFLMYAPIYKRGASTQTAEERRAAIAGWVHTACRMDDVMDGILESQHKEINLEVYDEKYEGASLDPGRRMFDSREDSPGVAPPPQFSRIVSLEILGHPWTLHFTSKSKFIAPRERQTIYGIAAAGGTIELLLFFLIWALATTRKRAELLAKQMTVELQTSNREIARSKERLELATGAADIGIWEWYLSDGTLECDDAMYRLFGIERSVTSRSDTARPETALPETVWSDSIHPDDINRVKAERKAALDGGTPFDTVFRIVTPRGKVRHLKARATVHRDSAGEPARMIGTNIDITDIKEIESQLAVQAEDLRRSNKELEQFAYVASHDLQEPLRMVESFAGLFERRYREQFDDQGKKWLGFLIDGASRMRSLVHDLLAYSRSGKHEMNIAPVDMQGVLSDVMKDLSSLVQEKSAKITSGPLPQVLGDRGQLRLLLQNLLTNAIKFQRPGIPPEIHISGEAKESLAVFSVKDNGIGIEKDFYERVFVIFQRLHGRDQYPGTGIGLAVCKKVVERHGGTIWVDSKLGEGSTFYFSLKQA